MRRGILAGCDELKGLASKIRRQPFDSIFDVLRKRCSLILQTPPVQESQWRSLAASGAWWSGVEAARTAQGRIVDLLIAHNADRNIAFRDRAIEELRTLCAWTSWCDPCHGDLQVDLCTAAASAATVLGLDWLWDDLSEASRFRVLQAIRNKAIKPYLQAVRQNAFWYECYHHWNAVVNSGCGLAALALSDDEPAAKEALGLAHRGLQRFFGALGREGGWDEGAGCWGLAMHYLLMFGEASIRLMDDRRIMNARGMDATGLFPIYFTPNGQGAGFGDYPAVPAYGTFYLLAQHHGLKEIAWWLDNYAFSGNVSASGLPSAGLALLFRPIDLEPRIIPELAPLKVFHEVGWAALADSWPRPTFYAAAKTGDMAASHSQHDMNSVQLQVDGEMLLVDHGGPTPSRDIFLGRKSDVYEVQARAHNTIVVGGRDHAIDSQGTVIEARSEPNHHWIACDASNACGDGVHFVRHLVMVLNGSPHKGRMLLVLDELELAARETVEALWHSYGQIDLPEGLRAGIIAGAKAHVHFAVAGSADIELRVDQRDVSPSQCERMISAASTFSGKGLILSAFAREKLGPQIEVKRHCNGDVHVQANDVHLHFKSLRKHLQLDAVTARCQTSCCPSDY